MAKEAGLIVSVSGIRGIVGKGLVPEAATAFAEALATHCGGGRMVLSRDGRPSGSMLRHAVLAGLLSAGCDVDDIGIAPTPTCGLAVRRLAARGAIQISASHNPAEWNGLKLFGPDGAVLPAAEGRCVQELFEAGAFRRAAWAELGKATERSGAPEWHRDRVLEFIDAPRIRGRRLHVFLDANGGAGGPLGRQLLDALECRAICQACEADGVFLHEPEPVEANLRAICPQVARAGADVGFVLDPDADRLAIVDEQGTYIGEELTLALATLFRLGQERGPVVVNMSTSRVCEELAGRFGCAFYRSPVGEANVVAEMRRVGALIGGEGNGGVIDPRVGWVRDPFIGMGLILNLMASTGKKLSQLAAQLPAYVIVKEKYGLEPSRLPSLYAALRKRWPAPKPDERDGLRLDWSDRWVHLRPSNTEPVVRVIAEGRLEADAQALCGEVKRMLQDV
jgi:phosphomannomutase